VPAPKDKPRSGYVALQSHSGRVEFRNAQIRELVIRGKVMTPVPFSPSQAITATMSTANISERTRERKRGLTILRKKMAPRRRR
jgi:hypothetical protein